MEMPRFGAQRSSGPSLANAEERRKSSDEGDALFSIHCIVEYMSRILAFQYVRGHPPCSIVPHIEGFPW